MLHLQKWLLPEVVCGPVGCSLFAGFRNHASPFPRSLCCFRNRGQMPCDSRNCMPGAIIGVSLRSFAGRVRVRTRRVYHLEPPRSNHPKCPPFEVVMSIVFGLWRNSSYGSAASIASYRSLVRGVRPVDSADTLPDHPLHEWQRRAP